MDNELVLGLYRDMLRIRLVEEGIIARYAMQEMRCPVHLSVGQEAVAVGVCGALEPADKAFSGHRSHSHYLAKGGDLKSMISEIYGKAEGCTGGFGGSMHLLDEDAGFMGAVPIVGATIPIGVGVAFAGHLMDQQQVVAIFFGDGACETGVFHESLNFSVLHNLPVVFVVENNLYSVYSPMEVRQPAGRSITNLAAGHGIATASGDGNDVVEVCNLTKNAVERARSGGGPTVLEFSTYRWREHCGPEFDNHIGYRTEAEFQTWREKDPVARFEAFLIEGKLATEDDFSDLRAEFGAEIDAAFAQAETAEFPLAERASLHVYAS